MLLIYLAGRWGPPRQLPEDARTMTQGPPRRQCFAT